MSLSHYVPNQLSVNKSDRPRGLYRPAVAMNSITTSTILLCSSRPNVSRQYAMQPQLQFHKYKSWEREFIWGFPYMGATQIQCRKVYFTRSYGLLCSQACAISHPTVQMNAILSNVFCSYSYFPRCLEFLNQAASQSPRRGSQHEAPNMVPTRVVELQLASAP